MGNLFNPDNAFFRGMGKIWDLFVLSVVWTLCSFPLSIVVVIVYNLLFATVNMSAEIQAILEKADGITHLISSSPTDLAIAVPVCAICMIPVGPALASIYYVAMKVIRRDRGYVLKEFFHAFKMNFKVGAITGAIIGAMFALLSFNMDYAYGLSIQENQYGSLLLVGTLAIIFILLGLTMMIFPVLSRFTVGVKMLFRLALYMAFRHFLSTVGVLIVVAVSGLMIVLMPMLVVIVPGVAALIITFFVEHVLRRYMPKPENSVAADGDLVHEGDVVSEDSDGNRQDHWYWE